MEESELLESMENILAQLNIKLRYEKGDFQGGICRIDDEKICFLNKALPIPQKNVLIANSLAGEDISGIFIVPAIREFIQSCIAKRQLEV